MADPEAKPNLALVDSIAPALLKIAESPHAAGKVFHLCHSEPQSIAEIIDLICDTFNPSYVQKVVDVWRLGRK